MLFMVMCVAVTGLRRGLVLLPYLQAADRTDQFPADLSLWSCSRHYTPTCHRRAAVTRTFDAHQTSTAAIKLCSKEGGVEISDGDLSNKPAALAASQLRQQKHSTCFCWRTSQCALCVSKKNADKKVVRKSRVVTESMRIIAH